MLIHKNANRLTELFPFKCDRLCLSVINYFISKKITLNFFKDESYAGFNIEIKENIVLSHLTKFLDHLLALKELSLLAHLNFTSEKMHI